MTWLEKDRIQEANASRYATCDDFCRVFSEELDGLYQLSLLMTGDHETAEKCFFASLEDCYRATHVFKDWALPWAKYTITCHAIRELKSRLRHDSSPWAGPVLQYSAARDDSRNSYFKAEDVLALNDFERLVFVTSVLERHSHRDCALLLGCSLLEIRRLRAQASVDMIRYRAPRTASYGNALTSGASASLITFAEVPTGR